MLIVIDQLLVPVAVTYGRLSSFTATLFTPVPPILSCEDPETIRLPGNTVVLLLGFVITTVGGKAAILSLPLKTLFAAVQTSVFFLERKHIRISSTCTGSFSYLTLKILLSL
jgi:hypothetical protein